MNTIVDLLIWTLYQWIMQQKLVNYILVEKRTVNIFDVKSNENNDDDQKVY